MVRSRQCGDGLYIPLPCIPVAATAGEGAEVYVVDVAAADGVKLVVWRMGRGWLYQSNGWVCER